MFDVAAVLEAIPSFHKFCSVKELHALVQAVSAHSTSFQVKVAGTSVNGVPIHHVTFGRGSIKALIVGFPHANEPIGGLTVSSLLTLLVQRHPGLIRADVEWHIVPCIDPDGAILNEGWTQKPFTLESYMRNFHRQDIRDQVDGSFPLKHKKLSFDSPSKEAMVLRSVISEVLPDFLFSLHNTIGASGAFYLLTHDIEKKYHLQLYRLLESYGIPMEANPYGSEWNTRFGAGIREPTSTKKYYDYLEKITPSPEDLVNWGATSWDYLAELKSGAVTFVAELPHAKHPCVGSTRELTQELRRLKLRVDADNKFVAAAILEEWDKVHRDLDPHGPFYKKIFNELVLNRDKLSEGLPSWPYKTRQILFSPGYSRVMTEGDRFDTYHFDAFLTLCHNYEFVRLLNDSPQTVRVKRAIERLEPMFSGLLGDITQAIRGEELEPIPYDTLARAQLGSGLIALNAIREARSK
jgi:Zinc carboxypeptidase